MLFASKKLIANDLESGARCVSVPAAHHVDTEARLCAVAKQAREKLAPWAALQLPDGVVPGMLAHELPRQTLKLRPGSRWHKAYLRVGDVDGVCIYLLIGGLDRHGRGVISKEELATFFKEVQKMIDNILGFITTTVVSATLSLSITVPLTLMVGSTADSASPALGGGWPSGEHWYSTWLNSAAMPATHWCELLFFGLSIYKALKAIIFGTMMYSMLTLYTPDTESRVYCLFDNVHTITGICYDGMFALAFLPVGLVFLGARTSPAACVVFALIALAPLLNSLKECCLSGNKVKFLTARAMMSVALHQLRVARHILRPLDA